MASFYQERRKPIFVIASQKPKGIAAEHFHLLSSDPQQVAFDLYYQLRKADASDARCIIIELPPQPTPGRVLQNAL